MTIGYSNHEERARRPYDEWVGSGPRYQPKRGGDRRRQRRHAYLWRSSVVLPLRRRQFRPPDRRRRTAPGEPPRELDLLVPEAGKLPLIGRKDLFAELQAWIDDEVDISVHALIGRAGTGKTRLALEFCAKIDSDPNAKGGWLAGFLSPTELTPVVETLATRHFAWQRPTLLVIDYAAQCHEALARWLDRLAGQKLDTKLRYCCSTGRLPRGSAGGAS